MARKKGKRVAEDADSANGNAECLYDWISEGYMVDPLVEAIRSGKQDNVEEAFRDYNALVERLSRVKEKMEKLGFGEDHASFQKVSDKFRDPTQVDALESFAQELEMGPRIKKLMATLTSLNTVGFEEEANRIKAMFDGNESPDVLENEIKVLEKKIKEKFFENSFEDVVVPEEVKPRTTAEIIFLLHRDGTLLSVKSRNPPSELDKKLMSRMIMAIKEQMSRAFKEGEHIHSLTYEGHTIILEDSVHVYAAVVIVGEAKPVMYRVILKALQIMERKLAAQLDAWDGDRSKLENMDKYVTAIFQALDKVN